MLPFRLDLGNALLAQYKSRVPDTLALRFDVSPHHLQWKCLGLALAAFLLSSSPIL